MLEVVVEQEALIGLQNLELFIKDIYQYQRRRDGSLCIDHMKRVGALAAEFASDYSFDHHISNREHFINTCHAGGFLHDVLRDTRADYEDIENVTSREVADIISSISYDKRYPVHLRNLEFLRRLEKASLEAQIIKLADITDNVRNVLRSFEASISMVSFVRRWITRAQSQLEVLGIIKSYPKWVECSEQVSKVSKQI